jgi:hypothetical protein
MTQRGKRNVFGRSQLQTADGSKGAVGPLAQRPLVTEAPRRDHRIDAIRGIALVMIFINHMPGNWLENWTSRNFGLSDAAEVFVLLAGVAAALAFFKPFANDVAKATDKAIKRARLLYLTHLGTTATALALFVIASRVAGQPGLVELIGISPILSAPFEGTIGLMLGGIQLGYFNILPMYVVLLLMLPAMLWLAHKSLWHLAAFSAAMYLGAQLVDLNLPNYPGDGGWFFNPFAWQALFAIGLGLGVLRLRGKGVPYHPVAMAIAAGYLLFGLIWVVFSLGGEIGRSVLPQWAATLHKSDLAPLRILHVLSLAYVLVHSPIWTWMTKIGRGNMLALMGRNSLPVFTVGSLMSMLGYVVLVLANGGFFLGTAMVALGVAAMVITAYGAEVSIHHTVGQRILAAFKAGRTTAGDAPTLEDTSRTETTTPLR